jgi:hypothetical protein
VVSEAQPVANIAHVDVLSSGDSFMYVVAANGSLRVANTSIAFSNSAASLLIGNLMILISNTPSNSSINCTAGHISCDGNNVYVAVANNTLKRIQLSSF